MKNVKMLIKFVGGKCGRDNKFHSLFFCVVPFGSQQNNCAVFSVGICTIHFLALKLIALRITCTPPG